MLSIRIHDDREWWVSGSVFERLFVGALEHGHLSPALEEWRHVADANGGFSFADMDRASAVNLKLGLRAAATEELLRLGNGDVRAEDSAYKIALEEFLALTNGS